MRLLLTLLAALIAPFAVPAGAQITGPTIPIYASGGGSGLVSAINSDGWSATTQAVARLTFLPDSAPQSFPVTCPGYDTNGNATTYTDQVIITKPVRFPYPSQATLNPARVADSDYVWSGCTSPGVVNNSALTAPQPIIAWVHAGDRQTIVSNNIHLEFVAAAITARAGTGKQIPYASCSATDGTLTVTTAATGPATLTSTTDQQPVIGYYCDIDTTTLANGQITANAKGYPWIGTSASIADSSTGTAGTRGWVPQVFTKSSGSRYYAYADGSGNDTSCVASTTAATASATPCLTFAGAINKCQATSSDDGKCSIRLKAGTFVYASQTFTGVTPVSEQIIEADPSASAGTVILQFGATNQSFRAKYIRLRNLTLSRQGAFTLNLPAAGQIAFENIAYDAAGGSSSVTASATGGVFVNGMTVTNDLGPTWSQVTSSQNVMLLRGLVNSYGATAKQIAPSTIVGSKIYNATIGYGANTQYGSVFLGFSKFLKTTGSSDIFNIGSSSAGQTATLSNIALIQSVFEWSGANSTPGLGLSRDPPVYTSLSNVVVDYVTAVGGWNAGRWNIFYDNNSNTTVRTHIPVVIRNSIISQFNIKGDMFVGTNGGDPTDAPLHTGNWAPYYGAGFKNNWYSYADAGSSWATGNYTSDFSQLYAGLNANLGHSTTVRLDPLFTTYAATTYNGTTYSAGAGDGDYSLQSGSTAKGLVAGSTLPVDLAGVSRPTTADTVGAYK